MHSDVMCLLNVDHSVALHAFFMAVKVLMVHEYNWDMQFKAHSALGAIAL